MIWSIYRLAAILAALSVVAFPAEKQMSDNLQRAAAHMDAFEKTRDSNELREAANILAGVDIPASGDAAERIRSRRHIFLSWVKLLNLLDRNLDPAFDPAVKPELNPRPPGEAGLQYASGTKPEDVRDPVLRKQFEDLIEKNRKQTEEYKFQIGLRRANETATPGVERFIRKYYSTAPLDQRELKDEIQKSIENHARAAQIERA